MAMLDIPPIVSLLGNSISASGDRRPPAQTPITGARPGTSSGPFTCPSLGDWLDIKDGGRYLKEYDEQIF